MASQLFCAADLGAESGRVLAGRFDGARLHLQELNRFPNRPARVGGTMQWDVLRLWNDILDGLSNAKTQLDGPISGIGVDTWGVDFGLLDERDQLIGNPIHYREARSEWIEKAAQIVSRRDIYERTGLQFMPFNTLFQLFSMQREHPKRLAGAHSLLFMPDLLHFWLCGAKANEYSIASTSQMLDAKARGWADELLSQLDLPRSILGQIVAPGTRLGTLRPEVAVATGLGADTPIFAPPSHDTASAVVAVPFEANSRAAFLSSGTWSLMGLELPEPLINDASYAADFTNEGGANGTIRFLKNIAGLWLVQGCRRTFAARGKNYSYEELTSMAAQASDNGPIIEPDDARFAAPDDMTAAIRDFCRETDQKEPKTEGELVRCCLDSLALKYRWTFEKLEEMSGQSLDVLNVVGGGTQNKLLSQLSADCLGKPLICGPVEGTATGNILMQMQGAGLISNLDEARAVVRASFTTETFEPSGSEKARWDEKFAQFERFSRA